MSHDIEASYAATEVVKHFLGVPANCFQTPPAAGSLSGYAAREGRHKWPHADGVIELAVVAGAGSVEYSVAMEFKRPNEGLHGVLTAIGQSHAYLRKGYAGSVIVIPASYAGFGDPGPYVKDVLDLTSKSEAIGVFTYSRPDMSKVSPFDGKLHIHRTLKIDAAAPLVAGVAHARSETQWAHLREGSSDPDAFFKYLQSVKLLGGGGMDPIVPDIPPAIRAAVERVRPGANPEKYLSNCPNESLADRAWRHFWFKYILHRDAIVGWVQNPTGEYVENTQPSLIKRSDGGGAKLFFVGRKDSIKTTMTSNLNAATITEDVALEGLVENYFGRAHSYREDIDSGCEHLGFVDSDGRLTDSGYRFVDACERYGNPNEGLPRAIFLNALLGEGSLGAFLHYVYKLSEGRFKADPLAFTVAAAGRIPKFQTDEYLAWLEGEMAHRLHVIRKVALRGGKARRPFQAEFALLRGMGIMSKGFRIGVGAVVNWPELQEAVGFSESSLMAH